MMNDECGMMKTETSCDPVIIHHSSFRIPIVAMTAHAMRGDRERCMEAGMDDYLTKPVEPARLAEALEKWLPKANDECGMRNQSLIPHHSSLNPDPGPPVFDRADLMRRLGDDEELAVKILRDFVSITPARLASLTEAMRTQDAKAVHEVGHALKGSSATIGAKALAAATGELEKAGKVGDLNDLERLLREAEQEFERLREVLEGR
jgi:HPt (histidine-containing phosphotransfer) domain-containing protein